MKSKRPKSKIRIGVIFGGRSTEHEVSLVSATSIINTLDPEKYEVVPIGITPEGKWLSSAGVLELLKSRKYSGDCREWSLLPEPARQALVEVDSSSVAKALDVVFPALHGTFGEDGTMQGLFELAGIPYVGAGVLGSSVGMDKVISKQLCEYAKVPVTPYVWFLARAKKKVDRALIALAERKLGYPMFIKPANAGSSVGISKAHDREGLLTAIRFATQYDRKILIERAIQPAREIEVSVIGNDEPVASLPGEIISSNEFYDYDAKYVNGKSEAIIPAKLPKPVIRQIQQFAIRGFKAIDGCGMARVDFLVVSGTNRIFLNELNTIPGFTSISMYPKLWEASGLSYPKLLDRLVELAFERHRQKQRRKTVFAPKSNWYR